MNESETNKDRNSEKTLEEKRGRTGELMSETARRSDSEGAKERGARQAHENRENPDADHVPGHKGYTRENLNTVNPTENTTRRES